MSGFTEFNEQMSRIVIQNLFNRTINSEVDDRKVIEIIHENGIDWMHACGKKGRCTTCKFILIEGAENLSNMNDFELGFAALGRLQPSERLACQAILHSGEIRVKVAHMNKFPHITYSE